MQSAPKPTNTETNADATPGGSQGGYEPPMPDPASDKVNQMMADLTNI